MKYRVKQIKIRHSTKKTSMTINFGLPDIDSSMQFIATDPKGDHPRELNIMNVKLNPCPICHTTPNIGYACGEYFTHCSEGCSAPMCSHSSESATACSWNDWAEWYGNHCAELVNRPLTATIVQANELVRALICKSEPCPCEWCDAQNCGTCNLNTENDDDECNFSLAFDKPLTLKQLRQMDGKQIYTLTETDAINLLQGKPVKCKLATIKLNRHMYLDVFEDVVEYADRTCQKLDWQYTKTWLAYACRPE